MGSPKKDPELIIDELQQEIDKHNYKIKQEKERTRERREEIKKDIGVPEIKKKNNEISDLVNEAGRVRDDIINVLYKGIWASMPRKTTYIDEKITIRDKQIYRYSESNDAKIRKVKNYKNEIIRRADDDRKEDVRKAFREIEDIEDVASKDGLIATMSIEPTDFSEYDSSHIRHKNTSFDMLAYGPKFRSKIVMANSDEIDGMGQIRSQRGKNVTKFNFTDMEYKSRIKHENVLLTSEYREEILELLDQVKQSLEEEIERRMQIEKNLNEIFKKQLMIADL